jgi:ferredoxin--NADP+ reductase
MTDDQAADLRQKKYNATVAYLHKPQADLMIVRVRPDFPRPVHKPGQYCTLGLGFWEPRVPDCQPETLNPGQEEQLVQRAYSISCSVLDGDHQLLDIPNTDWLEFYIVLMRQSGTAEAPALTPRLFTLNEGDRLFMGKKITGHYTSDPVKEGDTVLLLATGTGEAPHNYLVWDLLRRGHRGKVLSACCVRYRRDLGYLNIHDELMRQYPNYQYVALTTRETDTIHRKVYIQDLITTGQLEQMLGHALDPGRMHVYLCGNPKMIGKPEKDRATGELVYPQPVGVVELLERRGFHLDQPAVKKVGNIHVEEYW